MFLEACTRSLHHFFSRLSEAKCQRCDIGRRGPRTKPNCLALLLCEPLARESRFAVTGGRDKNYVSALRLVKQAYQPWSLN